MKPEIMKQKAIYQMNILCRWAEENNVTDLRKMSRESFRIRENKDSEFGYFSIHTTNASNKVIIIMQNFTKKQELGALSQKAHLFNCRIELSPDGKRVLAIAKERGETVYEDSWGI